MVVRALSAVSLMLAFGVCAGTAEAQRSHLPGKGSCLIIPFEALQWKITQRFHQPDYPFKKEIGEHTGIDIAVPVDTPVIAPEGGIVVGAGIEKDGTSTLVVRMRGGWKYRFLHMKTFAVKEGRRVKKGQMLGRSGGASEPRDPVPIPRGRTCISTSSTAPADTSIPNCISANDPPSFGERGIFYSSGGVAK